VVQKRMPYQISEIDHFLASLILGDTKAEQRELGLFHMVYFVTCKTLGGIRLTS
jgi:hypothetical protein